MDSPSPIINKSEANIISMNNSSFIEEMNYTIEINQYLPSGELNFNKYLFIL